MNDAVKPPVLRDMPAPSQSRSLILPRHRVPAEAKTVPPVARVAAVPLPAVKAASPTPDEAHARLVAEERQRAREEGLRQGLADAQSRLDEAMRQQATQLQARADAQVQELQASHAALAARVQSTLDGMDAVLLARLDSLELDAVELAFTAVCRMVGQAAVPRDAVAALVQEAIGRLRGSPLLRVRLHPDDLTALEGSEILARHPRVDWRGDTAVTAGGCLLDTEHGTLDARLDRQLARLRDLWVAAAAREERKAS